MRLSAVGAIFFASMMVAAAIGVIASHALVPGFARLTRDALSDQAQTTTLGVIATHVPLLRGD